MSPFGGSLETWVCFAYNPSTGQQLLIIPVLFFYDMREIQVEEGYQHT